MLEDIFIPFIAVGLAEFGDKTQLLILIMSSRVKNRIYLLLGISLAFLIVDGLAVIAGEWITNMVPINVIKIISGLVFIIFGMLIFKEKGDEEVVERDYFKNPFYLGFMMIFLSEWGDKTQIAAGLFAIKYNGLMVLFGVVLALVLLSIMAIYLGKFIADRVDRGVISKISGVLFIAIGISFLLF
jgi:putative Ca2+/H+ antiporter (TMEM165/GDT1 family)